LRANQFASPARLLGLIARLSRLARKVKSFAPIAKYLVRKLKRVARKVKKIATIAKYLVHELKRVARKAFCRTGKSICLARKAFRFNRQLGRLARKLKKIATIAKDSVGELKYFERRGIHHVEMGPIRFQPKNLLAVYAFGGPDSSASPRLDPTGGRNIGSRMT
jgi:hypothetical protein